MNRVRLAIIGAGHLGRIHARLARTLPNIELVAVVDPVAANRTAVATECGVSAFGTHRDVIDAIDAAVVATPTKYHHAVALDLLQQGKHVLVEKPITLGATDADELITAAYKASCVLQVGHVERFNPAFLAGQHEIREPKLIEAVRAAPYTGRSTDISVVLDLMIHDIDLALSLAQCEARQIEAIGGKVFGPNEDWAQARITFANGMVASLSASRVHPAVQRTMQVVGDDGMLWLDFQAKTARVMRPSDQLRHGGIQIDRLSPAERTELSTKHLPIRDLAVPENNALLEELRQFAQAIQTGASVLVDGNAGRHAVQIAEQVLAAIALGQRAAPAPLILPFLALQPAGPLRFPKAA